MLIHRICSYAHCTICRVEINISCGGISSVIQYIDSVKHSASNQLIDSSKSLGRNFREKHSPVSLKIAAAEGTYAFHTIKHHHSLRTMDSTSRLISVCFPDSEIAKNFILLEQILKESSQECLLPSVLKNYLMN